MSDEGKTLIITRKATLSQSTTIPLPFYAVVGEDGGHQKFFAITGEDNNLTVTFYRSMPPAISSADANELPADALQCSESVFVQAFVKARNEANKLFRAACPSINTSIPA